MLPRRNRNYRNHSQRGKCYPVGIETTNINIGEKLMELMNLVLFGVLFYLAFIGIPTLCEKHGK